MPGSLFHSQKYEVLSYTGNDGLWHFELVPIDGDIEVVSLASWAELTSMLQKKQSGPIEIPEFSSNVDLTFEEIKAKSNLLRDQLLLLDETEHRLVRMLLRYFDNNETIFFCVE